MKNLNQQGVTTRFRNNVLCLICLVSLLFSPVGLAQTYNWQVTNQPKIEYLSALSARFDNINRILLAAEHDGEWASTDGTNLQYSLGGLGLIQIHGTRYLSAPARPQNLYFLDLHGYVAYSLDDGMNWQPFLTVTQGLEDGFYALAIDPLDNRPSGQYLLAGGPGVIKYIDIPTTPNPHTAVWARASIGGSTNARTTVITDIQYTPGSSNNVWAATSEASGWDDVPTGIRPQCLGVLRSINGGVAWDTPYTISTVNSDANCVYAVAPVPPASCANTPNCLYAATKGGFWFGIYSNNSISWVELPLPAPLNIGRRISSIFYPYTASASTLYIGTAVENFINNGVYKTTDGGTTWLSTTFPPGIKLNALGGIPSNANTFYAAYTNGDLVKTTNGGGTPSTITNLQGPHAGYPMATVAISPSGNTVYVGTVCQAGVYKGEYNPNPNPNWTWTNLKRAGGFHNHFHYVMRLAQDPVSANILYLTEDDYVFRSTDSGATPCLT